MCIGCLVLERQPIAGRCVGHTTGPVGCARSRPSGRDGTYTLVYTGRQRDSRRQRLPASDRRSRATFSRRTSHLRDTWTKSDRQRDHPIPSQGVRRTATIKDIHRDSGPRFITGLQPQARTPSRYRPYSRSSQGRGRRLIVAATTTRGHHVTWWKAGTSGLRILPPLANIAGFGPEPRSWEGEVRQDSAASADAPTAGAAAVGAVLAVSGDQCGGGG